MWTYGISERLTCNLQSTFKPLRGVSSVTINQRFQAFSLSQKKKNDRTAFLPSAPLRAVFKGLVHGKELLIIEIYSKVFSITPRLVKYLVCWWFCLVLKYCEL